MSRRNSNADVFKVILYTWTPHNVHDIYIRKTVQRISLSEYVSQCRIIFLILSFKPLCFFWVSKNHSFSHSKVPNNFFYLIITFVFLSVSLLIIPKTSLKTLTKHLTLEWNVSISRHLKPKQPNAILFKDGTWSGPVIICHRATTHPHKICQLQTWGMTITCKWLEKHKKPIIFQRLLYTLVIAPMDSC